MDLATILGAFDGSTIGAGLLTILLLGIAFKAGGKVTQLVMSVIGKLRV